MSLNNQKDALPGIGQSFCRQTPSLFQKLPLLPVKHPVAYYWIADKRYCAIVAQLLFGESSIVCVYERMASLT